MTRRFVPKFAGRGLAWALFLLFASAFLLVRPASAADSNPESSTPAGAPKPPAGPETLAHQEQKQQQLKATTKRVGDQLEIIIAEFDRNGIAGEDVKVLRAIRTVLDKLSEKDMTRVVEFLQKARGSGETPASTQTATEAYAAQKSIIVQLQQLVLEYQRQQALYELSLRLKELATRQTANMWLGAGLAKSTEGKNSFSTFDENQKISLKYQQSEQNPLKDETAALVKKLERLSVEITDGATAERPKAALRHAQTGGLLPALESAAGELKEDNLRLLSAIGNEQLARDQLREMARLLILSQDPTDALKQAILELERAMETQKKVRTETETTRKRDDANRRATDQAAVLDETTLILKDVETIAPVASDYLRSATDRMQEARAALDANDEPKHRAEQAMPKQEDALLQMQMARRALEEQLARAESLEERPESVLAALRELREEVRELARKEEALKQQAEKEATPKQWTAQAPKQGELKDTAQRLQVKAAQPSPDAARSIGDAAVEMQKSQNSFAQSQNNSAAQQASIDALQRAEQQLAQDIEKLEQAEKDLAAIEDILKRLIVIIGDQQNVESATTREAVKPAPNAEALQALTPQQAALSQRTAELQEAANRPAPKAAQYLGNAKGRMDQAKGALEKLDPATAKSRETEALADLYRARDELERRSDELRNMLGLPPSQTMDALADAQQRIQKAQEEVNRALEELQQAPPGLMEALQKQQQEIARSLREMRQDSPNSKPLLSAHQSATEAAQQMARSNLPQALNSMKAAEGAMQEASKSEPAEPLDKLARQQADVRKAAEALADAQRAASGSSMQKAAQSLQEASKEIGPLTAGARGRMPFGAQSALQSALGASDQGSAQASAGQNTPAQMSATEAANALAQAQAALALAQAGLGSQMASKGQGQMPGQGQSPGQGQGQGQGEGQGKGRNPGKGRPSPQGTGDDGNWEGAGGAGGARGNGQGGSTFSRLPNRDRAAILQSQSEKYPQEFGPLVEQYLKNLSDQAERK
jgi:hypothetical protein